MRINTSLGVATLLAMASPTPGYCQTGQLVEILSEGLTTCGEFTTEPTMQSARMEWVLGYISGFNAGISRNAIAPESERMAGRSFQRPETAIGWLQSYCAAHPLDVLATAAEKLRLDFIRHER